MKPAIVLKTKYGVHIYNAVFHDFNVYKSEGHLDELKHFIYDERAKTEKKILQLLNDPDMIKQYKMDEDDTEGWRLYTELSDKYSTLNHFYNRK